MCYGMGVEVTGVDGEVAEWLKYSKSVWIQ